MSSKRCVSVGIRGRRILVIELGLQVDLHSCLGVGEEKVGESRAKGGNGFPSHLA